MGGASRDKSLDFRYSVPLKRKRPPCFTRKIPCSQYREFSSEKRGFLRGPWLYRDDVFEDFSRILCSFPRIWESQVESGSQVTVSSAT